MRFDKRLFLYACVSGVAAASLSSATFAQDSTLEEVTVTGIRGALKEALDIKRESNAVVDAVSAEDIGKFPDRNLAESLQRIPGISINRSFAGQGGNVSIRGTDAQLTQTLYNGQYIASTGWFSQGSNDRTFNMDLMPPEMVARIEVYKSPIASQDEGGVGGTVLVKTRKPLDLDPLTVFASAEIGDNSNGDDTGEGITGMISWKNDAETFGILGGFSTLTSIGRSQKAESYWADSWSGSGIAEFNQDRERDALNITFQFAPNDALTIGLNYFDVELDANNTNQNNLLINAGSANLLQAVGGGSNLITVGGVTYPSTGTATFASSLADDTNTRAAVMNTDVVTLDVDYQADGFRFYGVIGQTTASGGNGGNANGLWGLPGAEWAANGITVDFDFSLQNAMQLKPNGVAFSDPSWQRLLSGNFNETVLSDEETYAQADLAFDVEWGPINEFKTGLKLRNHEFQNEQYNHTIDQSIFTPTAADIGANTKYLSDFSNGTFSHGGDGLTGGSPTTLARINGEAYRNFLLANSSGKVWQPLNFGKVEEDITALYAQANFEEGSFRGNFGMRYVDTDITGTSIDPSAYAIDLNTTAKSSTDGNYSDWLPSFNLAVDITDDLIYRMSAARVMSRASYSSLSPSFTVFNTTTSQLGRGDPGLDPFRATQTDMGFEWYFEEEAMLAMAFFTKDIASFIGSKQEQVVVNVAGTPTTFTLTSPSQGQGGKVQGVEIQYQQTFGNFGAITNLTLSNGKGKDASGNNVDLPGNSRSAYNLTGFYENDIISARLTYTWRDEFIAPSTGIGGNVVWDDFGFLDTNVTWHLNESIDLSLEATNLLDETTTQRLGPTSGFTSMRVLSNNGTNYYMKASFRM